MAVRARSSPCRFDTLTFRHAAKPCLLSQAHMHPPLLLYREGEGQKLVILHSGKSYFAILSEHRKLLFAANGNQQFLFFSLFSRGRGEVRAAAQGCLCSFDVSSECRCFTRVPQCSVQLKKKVSLIYINFEGHEMVQAWEEEL